MVNCPIQRGSCAEMADFLLMKCVVYNLNIICIIIIMHVKVSIKMLQMYIKFMNKYN